MAGALFSPFSERTSSRSDRTNLRPDTRKQPQLIQCTIAAACEAPHCIQTVPTTASPGPRLPGVRGVRCVTISGVLSHLHILMNGGWSPGMPPQNPALQPDVRSPPKRSRNSRNDYIIN